MITNILFPEPKYNAHKIQQYFHNKTIIITGASFGIGANLVQLLSNTNCHLILVARTEEKLLEIQNLYQNHHCKITIIPTDLRDESAIENLITQLNQLPIDILIHNAGKSIRRSIWDAVDRFHDYKRTSEINYLAPIRLTLALLPNLKKLKGQLIYVSAINVLLPSPPKWSAYQSSKMAATSWMQCVAPELAQENIHTAIIYLPLVATRMSGDNSQYNAYPKMKAENAAKIILKNCLYKQASWKPWWLKPLEITAFLFPSLWNKMVWKHERSY